MSANPPHYHPPHTPDTDIPSSPPPVYPPHTPEDQNEVVYSPLSPTSELYTQKAEYKDSYSYQNQNLPQHAHQDQYQYQDQNIPQGVHPDAYQSRYYEDPTYYEPKTQETGADSQYYYDNQQTSSPPPQLLEPYPAQFDTREFTSEKEPEKKKRGYLYFICCPCCVCCPMWLRYVCCFLLLVIIVLAITAGALAGSFKPPTLDMNGVTDDPKGLPRFQRSVEDLNEDMAFTLNIGLNIGINNPNTETLSVPSLDVVAYYPTAPNVAIATGEMTDLFINRYGLTNFTFPVHIHYNNSADPGNVMLNDIRSKCAGDHDLELLADITAVVSVIGVKVPIPTIRRTIEFDCPVSVTQLPGLASPSHAVEDD